MTYVHSDDRGELVSAAEMRAAEARVIAGGLAGFTLMTRAGLAAADYIAAAYPRARRIAVLCGPGNNGGDGFVVAQALAGAGRVVQVYASHGTTALRGDAARAAAAWTAGLATLTTFPGPCDLIVDALFGIGITRPLDGEAAQLVERCNAASRAGVAVVALDLPSGIDANSGAVHGVAIMARETITFQRMKYGHVLEPGRTFAGRVHVADIGVAMSGDQRADVAINRRERWESALPRLDAGAHKYLRGHALVLAGGIEGVGASRLAARAALRSGAGLVTIGTPSAAMLAQAGRGPDALMVRACDGEQGLQELLEDGRRNAMIIGPAYGVGEATRRAVAAVVATGRACVLDADALTSFAGRREELATVITGNRQVVLTPHAGEFARLMGAATGGDKITRTRAAARALGATIVHKGADSVVASPDGRAVVNVNGVARLATAGSGDVLAGLIGGLMAQGMDAFDAASAGVFGHAATANRLATRGSLIADDLVEHLRGDCA